MHEPVLYHEVIDLLKPHPGGCYIDGTAGAGGHAYGLLTSSAPDGRLLAFDRDCEAIEYARDRLKTFANRVTFVWASFADMAELGPQYGFDCVDGILLDLGLSSRQLENSSRGFSFMLDGPLDMRFNPTQGRSAADLVNNLSEPALAEILWKYGEVRPNRKYARAIVRERPITTTGQLASVIARESGDWSRRRGRGRHPATLVFQALRIAVNDELSALEEGLNAANDLLKPGGRLAVISFHSLEDRMVKHYIRDMSRDCICPPEQPVCICNTQPQMKPVTGKPVRPTNEEITRNPRSRSASLRVAEKVSGELR